MSVLETLAKMTVVVLLLFLYFGGSLSSEIPKDFGVWKYDCQGPRTLSQVLDKLVDDEKIELADGVKFIKVNGSMNSERGRNAKESVLTRVKRFFSDYELQVKLSDILHRKQDVADTVRRALTRLNEFQEDPEQSSRGQGGSSFAGGKKGGNAVLMMATMMGGTMAALGFGALAMLVMKALTVSAMALLLSAVIGLRRLLRRPDDDFGRISYIPVHTEHRKKRSFQDLPYRAHAKSR